MAGRTDGLGGDEAAVDGRVELLPGVFGGPARVAWHAVAVGGGKLVDSRASGSCSNGGLSGSQEDGLKDRIDKLHGSAIDQPPV